MVLVGGAFVGAQLQDALGLGGGDAGGVRFGQPSKAMSNELSMRWKAGAVAGVSRKARRL